MSLLGFCHVPTLSFGCDPYPTPVSYPVTNCYNPCGPCCFVTGTLISTERGEVAVESLVAGDFALLANGGKAEIIWVGRRRIDIKSDEAPDLVTPIVIKAGAIGENLPLRDLRVSPEHALLIDGVLISAGRLINGVSIYAEPADEVTYFHVELDHHDAIIAEGMAAESYLDTGNRASFANVLTTEGDRETTGAPFAPFIADGPHYHAIRDRIDGRAGIEQPRAA